VQALVLCPTRELADQVAQEIRRLARAEDNIKVLTLCGGTTMRPQLASLAHGAHIVVGTPGRILDHLERGSLPLDGCCTWCWTKPTACWTWASPTTSPPSAQLPQAAADAAVLGHLPRGRGASSARRFLRDPQEVTLRPSASAAGQIRQRFYEVTETSACTPWACC
jgi:ATP-independent RNA helicase DbpA